MPKSAKKAARKQATEFELRVIAACLANKLARDEYSVEASLASLKADIAAWRKLAQAAERTLNA